MSGLPASIDALDAADRTAPVRQVATSSGAVRPRLHLERGSAGDPAPLLDLGTGTVLRTIVTAASRHAAEAGSASEIRDLRSALEHAVSLLAPELRHALLRSLEGNFGLSGAGEGMPAHVWMPTSYGALCEGCGFSFSASDPQLVHALSDTPCTGRYDDTAAQLRARNGSAQRRHAVQGPGLRSVRPLASEDAP